MNFEVIRNISLFLSVSLFVAVSGVMVVWEETSFLSSSLQWEFASIEDSVSFREHVEWQYCNPFEIKHEDNLPAARWPDREISEPPEKPTLPPDAQEWVEVTQT